MTTTTTARTGHTPRTSRTSRTSRSGRSRRLAAPLRRTLVPTGLALATFGGLLAGAPASTVSALDDQVCIAWHTEVETVGYTKDGEITEIRAHCDFWSSRDWFSGGKDGGSGDPDRPVVPGGPGGYDGGKEVDCDALAADIAAWEEALALALENEQDAQDEVDRLNAKAAADHARYVAARDRLAAAEARLEQASASYVERNGLEERERETRNGNTVSLGYGFNPFLDGGQEVLDAQRERDEARREFDDAWADWAGGSDPQARTAQQRLDGITNVIATYPQAIERARRDHHEHCS